jgi:hypothetical protein
LEPQGKGHTLGEQIRKGRVCVICKCIFHIKIYLYTWKTNLKITFFPKIKHEKKIFLAKIAKHRLSIAVFLGPWSWVGRHGVE